jgi:hypothetical protein
MTLSIAKDYIAFVIDEMLRGCGALVDAELDIWDADKISSTSSEILFALVQIFNNWTPCVSGFLLLHYLLRTMMSQK